jgi:hypothetical protein
VVSEIRHGTEYQQKHRDQHVKKKSSQIVQVNPLLAQSGTEGREVRLIAAYEEAELDEQWSYVGNKSNQRWFWYGPHLISIVTTWMIGVPTNAIWRRLNITLANETHKKSNAKT